MGLILNGCKLFWKTNLERFSSCCCKDAQADPSLHSVYILHMSFYLQLNRLSSLEEFEFINHSDVQPSDEALFLPPRSGPVEIHSQVTN